MILYSQNTSKIIFFGFIRFASKPIADRRDTRNISVFSRPLGEELEKVMSPGSGDIYRSILILIHHHHTIGLPLIQNYNVRARCSHHIHATRLHHHPSSRNLWKFSCDLHDSPRSHLAMSSQPLQIHYH